MDIIVVILMTVLTAALSFTIVWWLYLRSLTESLHEVRKNLRVANASLESHKESMRQIQNVLKMILSLDNLKKGEKNQTITFEPTLPTEERQRLIQYLRSEGFIS